VAPTYVTSEKLAKIKIIIYVIESFKQPYCSRRLHYEGNCRYAYGMALYAWVMHGFMQISYMCGVFMSSDR